MVFLGYRLLWYRLLILSCRHITQSELGNNTYISVEKFSTFVHFSVLCHFKNTYTFGTFLLLHILYLSTINALATRSMQWLAKYPRNVLSFLKCEKRLLNRNVISVRIFIALQTKVLSSIDVTKRGLYVLLRFESAVIVLYVY